MTSASASLFLSYDFVFYIKETLIFAFHFFLKNIGQIFRVRKKEPDVTTTTTLDVVTSENTIYDFYQVELRQASEVLNFNVRAFLLLPADIVQRSIRKQGGNLSTLGIDLGESYIRLARNFSQAQSMQTDLFDRMGINASIVPVTFKIGA